MPLLSCLLFFQSVSVRNRRKILIKMDMLFSCSTKYCFLNINYHLIFTVKMRIFNDIAPNSISQLYDNVYLNITSVSQRSAVSTVFFLVSLFILHTYGVCFSSSSFVLPFVAVFTFYSCQRLFRLNIPLLLP